MNACAPLLSCGLLLAPLARQTATTYFQAQTPESSAGGCIALAMLDDGLCFVETSAAMQRLLGREPEALAGRELLAFINGATEALRDEINSALARTSRWSGTLDMDRHVAPALELEWHIEGAAGGNTRFAVAIDIGERRRLADDVERVLQQERAASAESERLNRLKDDFIAVAVHELRHPLAPMQNAVYLLQHYRDDTHTAQKARDILERQLRQMTVLIDDLMDISRADRDAIKLDREWITLDSAVDAALETSQPHMTAAGQAVRVDYGSHLRVCIDRIRFGQVLVNILNNASKYTPRGGCIDVVVSRCEDCAEVAIVDSGVGIPPERLAGVFELFTQLHPAGARVSDGLGIGLALARRFMHLHGGSISASSAGEGKGSRFAVRLPLVETC